MNSQIAKRTISALIIIVLCFTLFSFSTTAVSLDSKGSITLYTLDKESKKPVSGAVFRIYLFATAYSSGDQLYYNYTEAFKDNGMALSDSSDAYFPIHLKTYADLNDIPYIEKASDSNGKVTFDNLQCGAYLVVPVEMDDGYLNPNPFIVTVPMKDEANNEWVYDIDATPKMEVGKDDTDEKTYLSVKKLWKTTEAIPESITVSLICDGVATYSVVLDATNNWYYRWDDLDKNHSWSVVEADVPEGYTVSYVTSQMTVVITNTHDDYEDETTTSPDETTTPDDSTKPGDPTQPGDTTKPNDTTTPTGTTEPTTKPEELIDTGQLNWPVPVFSIAGLLLFSIGYVMLNFGKKDEEAV